MDPFIHSNRTIIPEDAGMTEADNRMYVDCDLERGTNRGNELLLHLYAMNSFFFVSLKLSCDQ